MEELSHESKVELATEALEAYRQAETKADVEAVFMKYGRGGIGYRRLCRMFFSGVTPERCIKTGKSE